MKPTLFESVQGHSILKTEWDPDHIRLTTDKGVVVWAAEGGCCSRSYIENCDIEPGLVISVDETDAGSHESDDGGIVIRYHAVRVQTTGGWGKIEFRNESNGYYDGWLEVVPSS